MSSGSPGRPSGILPHSMSQIFLQADPALGRLQRQRVLVHRGVDVAGDQRVGGDAVAGDLLGEGLGEHPDGCLGGEE